MSAPSWRVPPEPETVADSPPAVLVSLHFLRAALRRRWRVWVGGACIGMLLGITAMIFLLGRSQGTVTLLLSHDPQADAPTAMSTDMSILGTRTVSERAVKALGIDETPEQFMGSFTAVPVTSSVMQITVNAPNDKAAIAYTDALSTAFLDFRSEQLRSQSDALVSGYQNQIDSLKAQVATLTSRYNALDGTTQDALVQSQIGNILTQRSQAESQIAILQQQVEDAELKTTSIVQASHVLDPPALVQHSFKKSLVLSAMSGAIGGAAIGAGIVLFSALTSNRLRRREEVALATGATVRFSARRLRSWWQRIPFLGGGRHSRGLQVLEHGLETALGSRQGGSSRVALLAVDNAKDAALVVTGLARRLVGEGESVFLVDLAERPQLGRPTGSEHGSGPVVLRPEGIPGLARGPVGSSGAIHALSRDESLRRAWDKADVCLTLAEVDPTVGVDNVITWADTVVLLVTAGRSSAERLRTTVDMIESAGLDLAFVMMLGTDVTDESVGLIGKGVADMHHHARRLSR